jgi:hypothetical protein
VSKSKKSDRETLKEDALEQIKLHGKVNEYTLFELKQNNLMEWYVKARGLDDTKESMYLESEKTRVQRKRRETWNFVDKNKKMCRNSTRYNNNNGDGHELVKHFIARQLDKEQKEFGTEVYLINKMKVDVLVFDDAKIIEIPDTETEKSIQKKMEKIKRDFGDFFEFIVVRVKNALPEDILRFKWDEDLIH